VSASAHSLRLIREMPVHGTSAACNPASPHDHYLFNIQRPYQILLTGYSRKLSLTDFDKFEDLDSLLKGFQSPQDTAPGCRGISTNMSRN
jgi:hypothetical protein